MLTTEYSKQFWKITIMFCTITTQITRIKSTISGNERPHYKVLITKTNFLCDRDYIVRTLYINSYLYLAWDWYSWLYLFLSYFLEFWLADLSAFWYVVCVLCVFDKVFVKEILLLGLLLYVWRKVWNLYTTLMQQVGSTEWTSYDESQ